jgi:hypothetical protein
MRPRFPDPFPKWNIRAHNGKSCPRSTTTAALIGFIVRL